MKLIKIAAVAVGLGLVLAATSTGVVSAAKSSLTATVGSTTFEVQKGEWMDSDGYIRLPLAELNLLAVTQTANDVAAVVQSGKPFNGLLDISTGKYAAAAYAVKANIRPMAITTGCGPSGHATSSRYVGGRGMATCFNGSGQLTISLPSTYYLSAGSLPTTWWYTGTQGVFVPAGSSISLSMTINVVSVTRGS